MKKKIAGLVLLLAVMAVVGIVFLVQGQQRDTTEVTGYLENNARPDRLRP